MSDRILVLAAVIERDGRFLLSKRLKGTHLEGRWEFPGGKCGPSESHEACLSRELLEELDVASTVGREIIAIDHTYPDRSVRLHFRECRIDGEPRPVLGQELRWVTRGELVTLDLPEADRALVRRLTEG
jgi:8-oxo-dGTP diphosphatase